MDDHGRARKLVATLDASRRHAQALRRSSKDRDVRLLCDDIVRVLAAPLSDAQYLSGATEMVRTDG